MKSIILVFITTITVFAQDNYKQFVQESSIPNELSRVLQLKSFDSKYVISYRINPFYLRGDFDNDGYDDFAVLIRRKSDSKDGIAFIHPKTGKMFICGAGVVCGNGGDDFSWHDAWYVVPKKYPFSDLTDHTPGILKGDGVSVVKVESAGGLIYWTGSKYEWLQQGD